MSIKLVKKEEFEKEIKEKEKVLADFSATWCPPCKALGVELEDLSKDHSELNILKVDVDEEQELAIQYGVVNVPTLIVIENGKEVNRSEGFIRKDMIMRLLN